MDQDEFLNHLYIELVKLQKEVIASGLKLVVVLEGRDAAGKDGMIKALTKHVSPRETRVIALGKPSDTQAKKWYFRRYSKHLPAAGETVIFNRSWYNRAGVERVMGFCTDAEYNSFFYEVELFEKMLHLSGIKLLKYYLDISKDEQKKRLHERREDPLKQWKISPIDKVAQKHWKDYSKARDAMLQKTNFVYAPWFVVDAGDKENAHIALISHLLQQVEYKGKDSSLLKKDMGLVCSAFQDDLKSVLKK